MWTDWRDGVLSRLGAPVNSVNTDTLWAWSNAESGSDVMRWNNPLNTTWHLPNSRDSGAQPGPHDVQIYPTIADGIEATVLTLLQQGYYPTIVSHLRNSVPRSQWGDACGQLGTWGTGCNWLQSNYGPAPGNLSSGGFGTMDDQAITDQFNFLSSKLSTIGSTLQTEIQAVAAAIANLPHTGSTSAAVDLQPILTALVPIQAGITAIKSKTDKDLA